MSKTAGIPDFDELAKGGIKKGEYFILPGIPNQGKSNFVHWMKLEQKMILMAKEENELILTALSDFLGREPEDEDFKKCMVIYRQRNLSQYELRYGLHSVCRIVKEIPWPNVKGYLIKKI